MQTNILICFFIFARTTYAQINGDFWWLSDKLTKLTGEEPAPPKFEELSEFDTDESAKIIFRDNSLLITKDKLQKAISEKEKWRKEKEINSIDSNSIIWPDDDDITKTRPLHQLSPSDQEVNKLTSAIDANLVTSDTQKVISKPSEDLFVFKYPEEDNFIEYPLKTELSDLSTSQNNIINSLAKPTSKDDSKNVPVTKNTINDENNENREDLFLFKFPEDDTIFWPTLSNTTESTKDVPSKMVIQIDDENLLQFEKPLIDTKDNLNSENICSYVKKNECYRRNGVIYNRERSNTKKLISAQSHLICCILPLNTESSKIVFPDSSESQPNRFRRSNKQESVNPALSQRDFLLRQKFRPQNIKPTTVTHTRVVTPVDDYYEDPYWNIKGSNLKKPGTHGSQKQDYDDPDYVEDYVVELPKPGLVGLYSDNPSKPSWSFDSPEPSYGASSDDSDEDDGTSFGYSTIDPRKSSSKTPKRGRPAKVSTGSPEDFTRDPEGQTVSFQSSPNFQVLQGFKLLNLGRNKNKFYAKNTRRSTTEGSTEDDSTEPIKVDLGVVDDNQQVFENCGRTARHQIEINRNDKQVGEAASGSHPWMALAVLTRRPQGILCYATIVHPRAAVTTGDCVYGRTSSKEITLLAGLWNLNDRSRAQSRFVAVTLHPQYRPKILAHDLALLHWNSPLNLNAKVQPACLGSAPTGDDCMFFGWGGFDQDVRPKPRWQRVSLASEQECAARLKSLDFPDDGFCVTVKTRGTVTGVGGPLICNTNGRKTAVGVSVWRDNALVLLPAQDWIVRAFEDLGIE
ncbi:uncharacterized protein LOC114365480 [Ostrinia furnacalis]|uniref:uncharacterized protein LOC114365480 n=1 Tax=Ostrinia furnacalis TaxID=93504 RepID=UPI001038928D|nr:uncharacterized protein LOC114365480 [Ostrinia furnacalis]